MRQFLRSRDGSVEEMLAAGIMLFVLVIVFMAAVFAGGELTGALETNQIKDTFSITNESWDPNANGNYTAVQLTYDEIVNQSETVSNWSTAFSSGSDYSMNDTTGMIWVIPGSTINNLSTDMNISYQWREDSHWGNASLYTGDLGEKGVNISTVGVILVFIFAAAGFIIYPWLRP